MPGCSSRPAADLASANFTSAGLASDNLASADTPSVDRRSIDDLDAEIRALARHMNAETYRLLVLVREFDDRLGWAKWGLRNCAEWLA
jgi:hypothetical protein